MSSTHRIEVAVVVVGIILFAMFLSEGTITGLVSSQVFYKLIDLEIHNSQSFVIESSDDSLLFFSSFSVSGEVIGSGAVKIVLDNGLGERRVIFSNTVNNSMHLVSRDDIGYSAPIVVVPEYVLSEYPSENSVANSGVFEECFEACKMFPVLQGKEFKLNVYIEPGTSVILKKIWYVN